MFHDNQTDFQWKYLIFKRLMFLKFDRWLNEVLKNVCAKFHQILEKTIPQRYNSKLAWLYRACDSWQKAEYTKIGFSSSCARCNTVVPQNAQPYIEGNFNLCTQIGIRSALRHRSDTPLTIYRSSFHLTNYYTTLLRCRWWICSRMRDRDSMKKMIRPD